MKIPISDALLDGDAEATLPVPLSSEQLAWTKRKADAKGVSPRQFVRYVLNKAKEKDEAEQRNKDREHKNDHSGALPLPNQTALERLRTYQKKLANEGRSRVTNSNGSSGDGTTSPTSRSMFDFIEGDPEKEKD